MNFDKLISIAATVVIGAAAVGKLDTLQRWIWRAQAKVIYESRSSTWGSPRFFPTQSFIPNHSSERRAKTIGARKP